MTLKEKMAKAKELAKKLGLELNFELAETKAAAAGDSCQLDDGTPGVMSDDGKGNLVCQPVKNTDAKMSEADDTDNDGDNDASDKPNSASAMDKLHERLGIEHKSHMDSNTKSVDKYAQAFADDSDDMESHAKTMMDEVDDNHDNHDKEVKKAINEFHNSTKAISQFRKDVKAENDNHRDKVMKTISGLHDKAVTGKDGKKGIAEAKDLCMKDMSEEHDRHIKAIDGLCQKEFDDSADDSDDGDQKAQKGQVADELAETELAQQKYTKLNKCYDIFYAFVAAYLDDTTKLEDYDPMIDEMVALMKDSETTTKSLVSEYAAAGVSSRKMSSKNREAVSAALDEHQKIMEVTEAAMDSMHEMRKSQKNVHATLKSIVDNGTQSGDEGKGVEQVAAVVKTEEITAAPAPSKIEMVDVPSGVTNDPEESLKAFLEDRTLRKELKNAFLGGLNSLNKIDKLAKDAKK